MTANLAKCHYLRILDLMRNGRISGDLRGPACAVVVVGGPHGIVGMRCVRATTPERVLRKVFDAFGNIIGDAETTTRWLSHTPDFCAQIVCVAEVAVPVVMMSEDFARVRVETLTSSPGSDPHAAIVAAANLETTVTEANLELCAEKIVESTITRYRRGRVALHEVDRPELLTGALGTALVLMSSWAEEVSFRASGCSLCGKRDAKLPGCSGCGYRWYCSKECHRSDWRAGHRGCCRLWGRMRRVVTARVAALTLG